MLSLGGIMAETTKIWAAQYTCGDYYCEGEHIACYGVTKKAVERHLATLVDPTNIARYKIQRPDYAVPGGSKYQPPVDNIHDDDLIIIEVEVLS